MKRLILSLLLSVTILPFNRVYAEVILLDNKMTEAEAIHTPYTLTTSMIGIGKLGNAKLAFKLNAITLEDFAEIPGSKICGIPGNNTVSEPKIPQIPAINYNLELPSQENCSIIISNAEYVEIPVVLAPGVEAEAGVNGGDIIEAITPYTGFFPENPIAQISLQNYKGLSIHGFSITPVLYDYENQKIRVYKSFDATITYVEGEKDTESGRSDIFKAQREIEKIGFTPNPVDNILGIGLKEYPREKTQDYLLIADNWNGDDLKEFIEWKKTLGFRVHFYNRVPGNPNVNKWTWEQLREFINQQYTELDNLTYVLIWGHPNNLPGIPFSEFESGKNKRDTATYTGYALENWDSTFPRFYVGRIHSQIPAQALEAVKKIIDYEKTPVTDPFFYSNAFLAGQFEGKGTNSRDNGTSPNLLKKEECETEDLGSIQWLERTRPILTANNINAKRIYKKHRWLDEQNIYPKKWSTYEDYNIGKGKEIPYPTQYEEYIPEYLTYPNFLWNGTKEDIKESLRTGSFLGIYYSHGNNSGWFPFNFTSEDFLDAQCGNKNPLIFSISCRTGDVKWNGSFANELVFRKDGPIGMIAASDISYVLSNQYYLYGLTNALFPSYAPSGYESPFKDYEPNYRFGEIMKRGRDFMYDRLNEIKYPSLKQHNALTYTCFGDPSIDIHTNTPTEFQEPLITNYGPYVYVSLKASDVTENPVYLNFYEKSTGRVESFVYDGEDRYFEADNMTDNVQLSITSHNKIPYIINVGVNDGESFMPRPYGKFTGAQYIRLTGNVALSFEKSNNYSDIMLRYILLDDNLGGVLSDTTVELDVAATSYTIPIKSGFKGYIQCYLIHEGYVLDSYKLKVY